MPDVAAVLRKRWDRGQYLRSYAAGEPWQVVRIPVKAPTAVEVRDDLDDVIKWAESFRRDSHTAGGRPRFGLEHRTVKGKGMGSNELPRAVLVQTFDQLCSLLGTSAEVARLDSILVQTRERAPELGQWVIDNPTAALEHHDDWDDLLATVRWVADRDTAHLYLRHLDLEGIDTKFVERHQRLLGQLLMVALSPQRVQPDAVGFAARFGFRTKPDYTRFRLLCDLPTFPAEISELRLRTDELATIDLPVRTVFVVENEISYLAFPEVRDAIVAFGEGFHVASLERLPWLRDREIVYWGDIDTHGFSILNRVRARFGNVRSILMDHQTLLAHQRQLVTEASPTRETLDHLTSQENALYQDLIEDRFGPSVRLEQERVRFSLVDEALWPWRR